MIIQISQHYNTFLWRKVFKRYILCYKMPHVEFLITTLQPYTVYRHIKRSQYILQTVLQMVKRSVIVQLPTVIVIAFSQLSIFQNETVSALVCVDVCVHSFTIYNYMCSECENEMYNNEYELWVILSLALFQLSIVSGRTSLCDQGLEPG